MSPAYVFHMSPQDFVAKWRNVTTNERASAQSHFNDLCRMLGVPTPHDDDASGERYAFERRTTKNGGPTKGKQGWADVWKRGAFAWEYKKAGEDLDRAYQQLLQVAAHFLIRLLFCLFAEDAGLLPTGLLSQLIARTRARPQVFTQQLRQLFGTMASGGWFGTEEIAHFNGGLFDDDTVLEIDRDGLDILNVVEGRGGEGQSEDIRLPELYVGESSLADSAPGFEERVSRDIDRREVSIRASAGQGDRLGTNTAPGLQHPAPGRVCGVGVQQFDQRPSLILQALVLLSVIAMDLCFAHRSTFIRRMP